MRGWENFTISDWSCCHHGVFPDLLGRTPAPILPQLFPYINMLASHFKEVIAQFSSKYFEKVRDG